MDTKKLYGFYSDGSNKLNGTLVYAGWCTEEEMASKAQGIVLGLRVYCSTARVIVYEVEKIENPCGAHPYKAIEFVRVQE